MRVAIQGQEGSYHDQAAHQFVDGDFELVPQETFRKTFQALQDDDADMAIVAIENSLFGSINSVYDMLLEYGFWVSGEVYLRIEHCLIGLPGAGTESIREVHTQLEAMAQCENFLDDKLPRAKRMEHHDTAASVQDVKKWNDPTKAAIASEAAAEIHGLKILEKGIQDNKQNYTRFVVLSKQQPINAKTNKTSIVLTTKSDTKAGALHKALGAFAEQDINLLMLQSRPIVGKAWHYLFYIDIESGHETPGAKQAITALHDLGFDVKILGSYHSGQATPE